MNTNLLQISYKLLNKYLLQKSSFISYSQCGEDLIISFLLKALNIDSPSYIDIGSHHPWKLNNTALFYLNGSHGINIEPDPVLFKSFLKMRKHDINLNYGVGPNSGIMDFYIMSTSTLNTFSKPEAERFEKEYNIKILQRLEIKVVNINEIIRNYFRNIFPDILSLDTEGFDFEILNSVDFSLSIPKIICVETISYSENGRGIKDDRIINLLLDNGYMLYADTYINTIFILEKLWKR